MDGYVINTKKSKKTDEIVKKMLGKIKTEKNKEYSMEKKRNQCCFPQLGMQGKPIGHLSNARYYESF